MRKSANRESEVFETAAPSPPDDLSRPRSDALTTVASRDEAVVAAPSGATQRGIHVTGHLAGVDDEGRVLFRCDGGAGDVAPVPVTIGISLPDGSVVKAARLGQRALVLRTDDSTSQHVLIALLRERVIARARDARPGELEVEVEGETLLLRARKKIEIRCGKSSFVMQEDGKVVLSGSHVVSRSRGPNKIQGASIALN